MTSAGFAFGVRRLLGLPYLDTQCGAKVLRREAAERIVPHIGRTDFLFDVDLLLAARDAGLRIVEVPTVWIDQEGSRVDPVGRHAEDGRRHREPVGREPPARGHRARDRPRGEREVARVA